MIESTLLSGLVLAGGRASRMQSPGVPWVDKGLVEFRGRPLLALACDYLSSQVEQLFISGHASPAAYAQYGTVVRDDARYGSFAGPLAGIASVLSIIQTPWLLVIPVDVVGLPSDMVNRLFCAARATAGRIAYASAERPHPLCMVLHRASLKSLQAYLDGGERRVMGWLESCQACRVEFGAVPGIFKNINSPADLIR